MCSHSYSDSMTNMHAVIQTTTCNTIHTKYMLVSQIQQNVNFFQEASLLPLNNSKVLTTFSMTSVDSSGFVIKLIQNKEQATLTDVSQTSIKKGHILLNLSV